MASPASIEPISVTEKCHFLEAPAEIRNHMYDLVLIDRECVHLDFHNSNIGLQCFEPPALTQVNQQIRHEARNIFFGFNTFVAEAFRENEWERCKLWLRATNDGAHHIPKAVFKFCCHDVSDVILEAPKGKQARIHLAEQFETLDCTSCEILMTLCDCWRDLQELAGAIAESGCGPDDYCRVGDMIWYDGLERRYCKIIELKHPSVLTLMGRRESQQNNRT